MKLNPRPIFLFFNLFLGLIIGAKGQVEKFQNRLENVGSVVKLNYNDDVKTLIDSYILRSKETGVVLGKSATYLPIIADSLKKYGVPTDLKYLAAALSGYDNWEISEDGGSGFWQMRYIIARKYGLNINSYVDQRREFAAASGAAARYLKDLSKSFDDWRLVIAAFYSDEVEVNKAIRKAGGSYDYWTIHSYLPLRHQKAVASFTAMVYMHHYHQLHKVSIQAFEPSATTVVKVNQWTTVYQLSKALETDFEDLKEMNPIFKKEVIPFTTVHYPVRIPANKLARFNALGDSIYTYPEYAITEGIVEPAKEIIPEPRAVEPADRNTSSPSATTTTTNDDESGTKVLYYTVRRGDYLGRIADMYDVGLSSMKSWNGLRSDRINEGQKLKVIVPANRYEYYKKINSMTAAQKIQIQKKD